MGNLPKESQRPIKNIWICDQITHPKKQQPQTLQAAHLQRFCFLCLSNLDGFADLKTVEE